LGFPLVTGAPDQAGPVNHVLPAWDVACGLYAALGVTAALRHRDATGVGAAIRVPLEDVALATAGNLGFLTEPMVNGTERERLGNAIYGQYGQTFTSADGVSFMVVALTGRHIRDLADLTGSTAAVAELAGSLGVDFADEGARFTHRSPLGALFAPWFAAHSAAEVADALAGTSILWERYRSFAETAAGPKVTANPLFAALHQPGLGEYLAPGLPYTVDDTRVAAVASPALGDDTSAVLGELGLSPSEVAKLSENGTVTTGSKSE
jgi:2-methylfumaryl-CoA isomerase